MFCGLLGGRFSKKCKQAVKLTKVRIKWIKKKKQAVVRIDRKYIAGHVAGRREANAFTRMDALIHEMNLVSCYEMIEKFCDCIVDQLPTLQRTRDCPEEAMEAVSTLIFAAARFHGLPELRDLRSLFAKRYENCMESSVNSEFAEKTRIIAFSREKKLELMKNITDEPKEIVLPQHEINVVQKHEVELEPNDIHGISTAETRDSFEPDNIEAHRCQKFDEKSELPQSKAEDQRELDCSAVEKEVVSVEILNAKPVNGRTTPYIKVDAIDKTRGKVEDQLNKNTRGRYLNPPYLILPKTSDTTNEVGVSQIEKLMPLTKDDAVSINKPTSIVRCGHNNDNAVGHGAFLQDKRHDKRNMVAMKDEEEMASDKLLLHFDRKGTDRQPKPGSRATKLDDGGRDVAEHPGNEGRQVAKAEVTPQRAFLLPSESVSSAEAIKTHVRGESSQSYPSSLNRGRAHPRLPDYDELVAKFSALKKLRQHNSTI